MWKLLILHGSQKGFLLSPAYKHLKGSLQIEHQIEENQQHIRSFFQITNEGKTAKNQWENDDSDFLEALYNVYKKLGQFFFQTYFLTC